MTQASCIQRPDSQAPVRSPSAWKTLTDLALLTAAFVALFHELIFFDRAMFLEQDAIHEFYPLAMFSGDSLSNGEAPLWDPFSSCGYPHAALAYSGAFHPFSLLYGLCPPHLLTKIDALLHTYLYGLFTYFLGRHLFRHRLSAVYVGILAMSCWTLMYFFQSGAFIGPRVFVCFPLALAFLCRYLANGRRIWAVCLSLALGVQLLYAQYQMVLYFWTGFALFAGCGLVCRRFAAGERWPTLARKTVGASLAVAGALALGAVQLLPFHELVSGETAREASVSWEELTFCPLTPEVLAEMLAWNEEETLRFFLIGPLGLAMACFGALCGRRPWRWPFLITLVVCVLYAMGDYTPLFNLVPYIPLLNSCRVPYRMLMIAALFVIPLAGFGLDRVIGLARNNGLRMRHCLLFMAPIIALLAPPYVGFSRILTGQFSLAFLAIGCVAVLALRRRRTSWLIGALVLALCAGQVHFGYHGLLHSDPRAYEPDADFKRFRAETGGLDRVALFETLDTWDSWPSQGLGILTKTRFMGGYNALPLRRYCALFEMLGAKRRGKTPEQVSPNRDNMVAKWITPRGEWLSADTHWALNLLNVRYLVTQLDGLPYPNKNPEAFRKTKTGRLTVYENLEAFPLAFTVHNVDVRTTKEEALHALGSPGFDHRGTVLLSTPFDSGRLEPATGPEPVTVVEYGRNRVELDVTMTAPGLLVLTDMFYPGWQAEIDGAQSAEVLCADHLLRAVFVPKGNHRVRFAYRPASIRIGATISALAWGVFALLGARALFRRRTNKMDSGSSQGGYADGVK